jgi:hypothetical protein
MLKNVINFAFAITSGFVFSSLVTQCSIDSVQNNSPVTQVNPENLVCQSDIEQPILEQQKPVCPENMVEIKGVYCTTVVHICKTWISEKRDRCAEYYPTSKCLGKLIPMRFCVDVFEYPNIKGVKPLRNINFFESKELCEQQGKRLCTTDEWTFACTGPRYLPYSYGIQRNKDIANIDKKYIEPDNDAWVKNLEQEMARLDQSEPSGSRPEHHSEFGVYDLDGNVDEITYDPSGSDDGGNGKEAHYKSALKGGYWAPVRNRCYPVTATHNAWHKWYNEGTRCCKDAIE